VVAAVLLALLFSTLHGTSWTLCAAVIAFTAVASIWPWQGMVLLAMVLPLGSVLAGVTDGAYPWTDPVAGAFLLGWLLRRVRTRHAIPVGVAPPAAVMTALALASAAVTLALVQARSEFWRPFLDNLFTYCTTAFFTRALEYHNLNDAVSLSLGMGLAWAAASLVAERPDRAPAIVRTSALAAAVVGAFSLLRLVTVALAAPAPSATLAHLLVSARFSPAFRDYNAAGSLFAMALTMAALGVPATRAGRVACGAVLALAASGLWLSGSRTALAAAAMAIILGWGVRVLMRRMGGIPRAAVVAAVLLVAAGATWATMARPRSDDARATTTRATRLRLELAATAMRMTASAPVFGIGIGEFYDKSAVFSSEVLRRTYPRENAHNYFLQVLAELGVAGFVAFAWLLVAVLRPLIAAAWTDRSSPSLLQALAWGLVVFLVTCLGGHPLLIQEVAFTFWILAGVGSGLGEAMPPTARARRLPMRIALVAATVALVLVPVRASRAIRTADFEHLGVGLSGWRSDGDGVHYRETHGPALVFVPSGEGAVELSLRAAGPKQSPLVVDLYLEGRLANRVRLTDAQWTTVSLIVPRSRRRFDRLELRVVEAPPGDAADDDPRLLVGKTRVVGQ
jgi:O-antigen ligase